MYIFFPYCYVLYMYGRNKPQCLNTSNAAKYHASLSEAISIANYKSGKNRYRHNKMKGKTCSDHLNLQQCSHSRWKE